MIKALIICPSPVRPTDPHDTDSSGTRTHAATPWRRAGSRSTWGHLSGPSTGAALYHGGHVSSAHRAPTGQEAAMRILPPISPTPEQLIILGDSKPGFLLIRGAAGSGKTTTALYRLQQLCRSWLSRRDRLGLDTLVRVLVLTYNRTLEGYISELARTQVTGHVGLELQVLTFGKWAVDLLGGANILDRDGSAGLLRPLIRPLSGNTDFLIEEVEYVLGRFEPDDLDAYLQARRGGRGTTPRVDQALRRRLLEEVVAPYTEKKKQYGSMDWNDIAV